MTSPLARGGKLNPSTQHSLMEDEKYVAKTNSMVVLNSEQIESIRRMGLFIFTVQKIDDTLIVRFSSGGGF